MADNLAKGSKELKGKGGSLEGGKALKIKKGSGKSSDATDGRTPKSGADKLNETGKGSGGR